MYDKQQSRTVCPNCGAEFPVEEPRCPYCGLLNPSGAEKAYMGQLDTIKHKTDDLDDSAQESFETNLKSNAKRTIIVIIAVAAVLIAALLAYNCMGKSAERHEIQDFQARETFREQHFDELDRLYDAGDYEELSTYAWGLSNDPGFDALFSWKHIGFLQLYNDWEGVRAAEEFSKSGECSLDDYTWAVSLALRLAQLDGDNGSSAKLSQDEEERAADYRAYAWQYLRDVLQMDDDEIAAFADTAKDADGNIRETALRPNLETRLKQLDTSFKEM